MLSRPATIVTMNDTRAHTQHQNFYEFMLEHLGKLLFQFLLLELNKLVHSLVHGAHYLENSFGIGTRATSVRIPAAYPPEKCLHTP